MQLGIPPITGDEYKVKFKDGSIRIVAFDIQQGWIDQDWNHYSEKDMVSYEWYSD